MVDKSEEPKVSTALSDQLLPPFARRHPFWAAAMTGLFFLIWTFPVGVSEMWPAFVRDKTIPEWLAERQWSVLTGLYPWLVAGSYLVVLMVFLWFIFLIWRATKLTPVAARSIETQLEAASISPAASVSSREADLNIRLQELCRFNWLYSMAINQASQIASLVILKMVLIRDAKLTHPVPGITFGFAVRNENVLDITVGNEIDGHISFGNQLLWEKPRVVFNGLQNTGHLQTGGLILEQRLTSSEADLIAKTYDKFYFDGLKIPITGGRDTSRSSQQFLAISRDEHAVANRDVRLIRASLDIQQNNQKLEYKTKVWCEFQSMSERCIKVRTSKWLAGNGIEAKHLSDTLYIRVGTEWYPKGDGLAEVLVPPGGDFRSWVAPTGDPTAEELQRRCNNTNLGTLFLLIDGQEVQVRV
jgi:hypothetical protein